MGVRYPGRAAIDPSAPEAVGVCDRCGHLYNLRDLRYQPVYAGPNVLVTRLRVCTITCWDELNPQLKTIRIPPDPWPVSDPRVENFTVDEQNILDLKAIIGKSSMFLARSLAECELFKIFGLVVPIDGTSVFNSDLLLNIAVLLEAELNGTAVLSGVLSIDLGFVAEFNVTSVFNAELEQVAAAPSRSKTDDYTFIASGSHTETGASFGAAVSGRQIYVTISGYNATTVDGIDGITIGGVVGTLVVEELVESVTEPGDGIFSAIYYAIVPTGTTGNIVCTFTGDTVLVGVTVYRVINADAVSPINSTAQANVASGAVSANITPSDASVSIGTAFVGVDSSVENITWTNLTEDTDQNVDGGGGLSFYLIGAASREDSTSPGSIAISANATSALIPEKTLAICNIIG